MKLQKTVLGLAALVSLSAVALQTRPAIANNPMGMDVAQEMESSMGGNSIVAVAASSGSFDILTQAIQAANLANQLRDPGPYTVFAPTDEAFSELPEGALDYLLRPENQALLQRVLAYHVVPDRVSASELTTGGIDTLTGGVAVRITEDRVIVNNASVVNANIDAENGIIHAVNRVLMPREIRNQLLTQLNR